MNIPSWILCRWDAYEYACLHVTTGFGFRAGPAWLLNVDRAELEAWCMVGSRDSGATMD